MSKKKKDFNVASVPSDHADEAAQDRAVMEPARASEDDPKRYDPVTFLFKQKRIVLAGEVNAQMFYNVLPQINHLAKLYPNQQIEVIVNSPGGSVIDGLAIVDALRLIGNPIKTIGMGMQASMGSIFLAAGDDRLMTRSAGLMIHQIMTGAGGGTQHTDFAIREAHTAHLHEQLKNHYVEFTGLNHEYWDKVMERDTWFTAEQALAIGFIHGIVEDNKPRGPYAEDSRRVQKGYVQKMAEIKEMSRQEVLDALATGQANLAEWGRYRPELAVRLAEFPEYWTAKRRAEAKSAFSANDDKKVPAKKPSARKSAGPR